MTFLFVLLAGTATVWPTRGGSVQSSAGGSDLTARHDRHPFLRRRFSLAGGQLQGDLRPNQLFPTPLVVHTRLLSPIHIKLIPPEKDALLRYFDAVSHVRADTDHRRSGTGLGGIAVRCHCTGVMLA